VIFEAVIENEAAARHGALGFGELGAVRFRDAKTAFHQKVAREGVLRRIHHRAAEAKRVRAVRLSRIDGENRAAGKIARRNPRGVHEEEPIRHGGDGAFQMETSGELHGDDMVAEGRGETLELGDPSIVRPGRAPHVLRRSRPGERALQVARSRPLRPRRSPCPR